MTETTRRDPNETPNYEQLMERILLLTTELVKSNSLINSRIEQAEKNKEIASNIVKLIGPANYTSWLVMQRNSRTRNIWTKNLKNSTRYILNILIFLKTWESTWTLLTYRMLSLPRKSNMTVLGG